MRELGTRNYIEGKFIQELNNRFLCEVEVEGSVEECYVPSSCKLGNFLDLKRRKVILVPTVSPKSRTKYALFALPYRKNYIILNPSLANRAMENSIKGRRFSFLGIRKNIIKEHIISDYKCDLYIQDTDTIVEIKSVISRDSKASFPTVYSERALKQLKQLANILENGTHVFYCIVSLNPYAKEIAILQTSEFHKKMKECIEKGLILKGYSAKVVNGDVSITKEIPIQVL